MLKYTKPISIDPTRYCISDNPMECELAA